MLGSELVTGLGKTSVGPGTDRDRAAAAGRLGRQQEQPGQQRRHPQPTAPASLFTRWAKLLRSFFSFGGMIARQ